jgi:AcrR family transcriptional regulator
MKNLEKPKKSARERILDASGRLFYRSGFHSVGVDTIVAESGITKMTMYKHFPSKDHLITAYLERYEQNFWNWFEAEIKGINDPAEQLIAFFEAIGKMVSSPQCLGCTFQSVAVEFPSPEHMAHKAAIEYKQRVIERFRLLAKQAGLNAPLKLAHQLLLLMDGAWISARLHGPENPARDLAKAAQILIESYQNN